MIWLGRMILIVSVIEFQQARPTIRKAVSKNPNTLPRAMHSCDWVVLAAKPIIRTNYEYTEYVGMWMPSSHDPPPCGTILTIVVRYGSNSTP